MLSAGFQAASPGLVTPEQLQTLCGIAVAAGREIMDVYAGACTVWSKGDSSPLTEADLRADAVIRRGLEAAFPGTYILSEESRSETGEAVDTFFLVDPLDGTKEFLKRNGEFTVNIALVHQGSVVAGVVLAPALDELYYAARGQGAWLKCHQVCTPLRVAPVALGAPLRVVGSRSHGADAVNDWLGALPCAHVLSSVGSSFKFCRIANGQADIYPRLGPTSQWDTAAAQCVLEQAGGAVLDGQGASLCYGLDRPILNPIFFAIGDKALQSLCKGGI